MKKVLALALVVVMIAVLFAACSDSGLSGTYKFTKASAAGINITPSELGSEMSFTFKSDGTGTASFVEKGKADEASFTWVQEGDKVTVTVRETPMVFTMSGKTLEIEEGGMTMVFEKQ